ncbi:hypothetical protein PDE_01103 [Penicillium oxalicum 114-2]|uniref:Uncharacterized protein n=1 Tax=Penicillium oxalicum (strain 114-2 / CGMCC 5302) TaxID=933388 RepID=S8AWB4_PENO1|nr:hypothetical protein PDE_01103 [Penicillium oxalicum 114-2]
MPKALSPADQRPHVRGCHLPRRSCAKQVRELGRQSYESRWERKAWAVELALSMMLSELQHIYG